MHVGRCLSTVCWRSPTCAVDPGVLLMGAVNLLQRGAAAVQQVVLIACAVHLVQPDGAVSPPKCALLPPYIHRLPTVQLPADHLGVLLVPGVVTHRPPLSLQEHLHPPRAVSETPHQPQPWSTWKRREGH